MYISFSSLYTYLSRLFSRHRWNKIIICCRADNASVGHGIWVKWVNRSGWVMGQ